MNDIKKISLENHAKLKGKLAMVSKVDIQSLSDLAWAYSPGVSAPCEAIYHDKNAAYTYTGKGNLVAVITDGSAVLGMGNISPDAAMPVMEGKAILFKSFADINAMPLCIDEKNSEAFVQTCIRLAPSFGGINLEDIAAPQCFEIEKKLIEALDIPVFHDDQHGTAIVTAAALLNGAKFVKKNLESLSILLIGTGAAGNAIAKTLHKMGIKTIQAFNRDGAVHPDNPDLDTATKALLLSSVLTPTPTAQSSLNSIIQDKDVVIGVSTGNLLTAGMISSMANDAMVFAMANPTPEIDPKIAIDAGATIVGTGRSDYPNQINNVLAFPGIFRAVLNNRIRFITDDIKLLAAKAIANTIKPHELKADYIVPSPLDSRVVPAIVDAITTHHRASQSNDASK